MANKTNVLFYYPDGKRKKTKASKAGKARKAIKASKAKQAKQTQQAKQAKRQMEGKGCPKKCVLLAMHHKTRFVLAPCPFHLTLQQCKESRPGK